MDIDSFSCVLSCLPAASGERARGDLMRRTDLQERLEGTRSNLRFADKRIADLEAQLLEWGHT